MSNKLCLYRICQWKVCEWCHDVIHSVMRSRIVQWRQSAAQSALESCLGSRLDGAENLIELLVRQCCIARRDSDWALLLHLKTNMARSRKTNTKNIKKGKWEYFVEQDREKNTVTTLVSERPVEPFTYWLSTGALIRVVTVYMPQWQTTLITEWWVL